MAFADTIGAVATVLNLPPGAGTTTVESKTNFISAIRAGEIARAECTPVHRGKTTGVDDAHPAAGREARRHRHADPDGARAQLV